MADRRWWRENRWWLLALPVAVIVLGAGSAYNVKHWWYDGGLHHEIAAGGPGAFVSATDPYRDPLGATSRTFRVRLASVEETASFPHDSADDTAVPHEGLTAWRVSLDWEADPDQVLRFCTVSLLDDQGRRYDTDDQTDAGSTDLLNPCTPADHGGPYAPERKDQERGEVPEGEARPPSWSTEPVILVPEGRRVTQVLVWWAVPEYVQLSVP